MSEDALSSTLSGALVALVTWLDEENVPNAIIGGVGVSLAAQPRFTQDIDAVLWIDSGQWEALIESAVEHGFSLRERDAIAFARRVRVLLLKHEDSGVEIDLSLGALPFERELIDRAEFFVVHAVTVKVATPEDLIVTKAVAQRAKDIVDIETILNVREDLDLSRVRSWVRQFADALETPEIFDTLERLLLRKQKLKRRKPRR